MRLVQELEMEEKSGRGRGGPCAKKKKEEEDSLALVFSLHQEPVLSLDAKGAGNITDTLKKGGDFDCDMKSEGREN